MNILSSLHAAMRSPLSTQAAVTEKSTAPASDVATKKSNEDKVTLSAEGKQAASVSAKTGVEQYALPSWFMEFSPEFFNLGSGGRVEEGRRFVAMSEKLGADGDLSKKDQHAIQSYLDNEMPMTSARRQVEAHYLQNQNLFSEYGAIRNKHLNDALAEHGIVTQEDWNQKVLNVDGDNQALRFSIMEKMFNDPRAMELMSTLGIKRPSV